MINQDLLPVESIQERDIDMLLLEELIVNPAFVVWLIPKLEIEDIVSFNGVWKSVSGIGMGETDILISYNSAIGII